MTRHTKLITKDQQARWWAKEPRRAFLFGDRAFAYIRREQGRNWITLGVDKKSRGEGLGTLIYRSLRPCWAEIRPDNEASIRAAQKAGYVVVSRDDEKVVMKG